MEMELVEQTMPEVATLSTDFERKYASLLTPNDYITFGEQSNLGPVDENTFKDPENLDEELKCFSTFSNVADMVSQVNTVFPSWYVGLIVKYSDDYPDLTKAWALACKDLNPELTPKAIIVTRDEWVETPDHILSNRYCEMLSWLGFSVRKMSDLVTCAVCHAAIPQVHMYELLKESPELQLPSTWSNKCSCC